MVKLVTIRSSCQTQQNLLMQAIRAEFDTFATFELVPVYRVDNWVTFQLKVDDHAHSQIQEELEHWVKGYVAASTRLEINWQL